MEDKICMQQLVFLSACSCSIFSCRSSLCLFGSHVSSLELIYSMVKTNLSPNICILNISPFFVVLWAQNKTQQNKNIILETLKAGIGTIRLSWISTSIYS